MQRFMLSEVADWRSGCAHLSGLLSEPLNDGTTLKGSPHFRDSPFMLPILCRQVTKLQHLCLRLVCKQTSGMPSPKLTWKPETRIGSSVKNSALSMATCPLHASFGAGSSTASGS